MSQENLNDLISIDELCTTLAIGKNTAYKLLNNKEISAFRIGRCWKIPRQSISEYIIRNSYADTNHIFCSQNDTLYTCN